MLLTVGCSKSIAYNGRASAYVRAFLERTTLDKDILQNRNTKVQPSSVYPQDVKPMSAAASFCLVLIFSQRPIVFHKRFHFS
jgi:hypothetical protein